MVLATLPFVALGPDAGASGAVRSSGAGAITPLRRVASVASDGANGFCAVSGSSRVVCWGWGKQGQLGDGVFYSTKPPGSAVAVGVDGVGGVGRLDGVASLSGGFGSFCALLISGGVDCWGAGTYGQLGDGTFYKTGNQGSAVPVEVEGVGGSGGLSGVASLTNNGEGFCALLISGGVDCWGLGQDGRLGNGTYGESAFPVQVEGVGGTGSLSGVAALSGTCALLGSGGVDCWGEGNVGELGDGTFGESAVPVQVEGVGGSGSLSGVAGLTSGGGTNCVLVTSGGVDCWGDGYFGQLGDGTFYTSGNPPEGSAVPVQVEGVGGTGTLSGVAKLASATDNGFCAVLTSGGVDCWGHGPNGQLGDGVLHTNNPSDGSAVPVQVEGVGGTGTLSNVADLTSDGFDSYCAVLTSGGVDCWGDGHFGQLGDDLYYTTGTGGSASPVQVEGIGGTGTLGGVASMTSDTPNAGGYCATLLTGGVDCWGYGKQGELGNGTYYATSPYGSATPVEVLK